MSAPNPTRPLTVDDLLTNVKLGKGYHLVRSENVCATEAVAWLAGEPHTQVPKCLSPVICRFLQPWNDNSDQAGRDLLLALLPRTVGTAGDGHDEARGWLAADWLIRVHTPAWLDLAGLSESAGALRALPELQSIAELRLAQPLLNAAGRGTLLGMLSGPLRGMLRSAAAWDAARQAAAWAAAGAAPRSCCSKRRSSSAKANGRACLSPCVRERPTVPPRPLGPRAA